MRSLLRLGVRQSLALVAVVPVVLAIVATLFAAGRVDRESRDALASARELKSLAELSQATFALDAAYFGATVWAFTPPLREEWGLLVEPLVAERFDIAEDAIAVVLGESEDVIPARLEDFRRLREQLRSTREAFVEGDIDALGRLGLAGADGSGSLLDSVIRDAVVAGTEGIDLLSVVAAARRDLVAEVLLRSAVIYDTGLGNELPDMAVMIDRSDRSLGHALLLLPDPYRSEIMDLMETDAAKVHFAVRELVLGDSGNVAEDAFSSIGDSTEFLLGLDQAFDVLINGLIADAERTAGDASALRQALLVTAAAILVVGVGLPFFVGRRLSRRIGRVADQADRISDGDLSAGPGVTGSDEVAKLSVAIDEMRAVLVTADRHIQAIADGNTGDPSTAGELPGQIGATMRAALRRLNWSTERLKAQATHDGLTGLLDRRGLEQIIDAWHVDRSEPVGVVLVDLDGFKEINDTWGHDAGDAVLREIARRLESTARSEDVIARLGGDEFVLLVPMNVGAEVVRGIADRIVEAASEPIEIDAGTVGVGASVGWVVATVDDSLDDALRRADAAMYDAKRSGRGRSVRASA